MAIAEKTETAQFVSKGRNYRAILLNPIDHPHHVTAERVVDQRGFTAEFARTPFLPQQHESDGSFQWPPRADDPEAEFVTEDGLYKDPASGIVIDVIAKLRDHPDNGVRFTEIGPSPEQLLADQRELMSEITRCIASKDVERLASIYDEETAGPNREAILSASMEGLRAVEEALIAEREPS